MKILMLTPYLPYPLWSGGQIRTYNLLKNLAKIHDITLFSFIRKPDEVKYISELEKYCSEVKVFMKRPPWSFTSLSLSAITFYPLVVCLYLRNDMKNILKQQIEQQKFDLIHAETFYVMPNIPRSRIPIILAEQTIEYMVYRHFTRDVNMLPLKLLMSYDVAKIHFWEKRFWRRASRIIAMSHADRQVMLSRERDLTVDLVPNGVDTEFFRFKEKYKIRREKKVLFVGNFKWLQNREAVEILAKKVWPIISKELPNVKLWIVGKFPTKEIYSLQNRNISVLDNVDDIRDAYYQSDVMLAPIYGPGGTRYKILESMAAGLPVVTTTTGIEGLNAENRRDALVSDDYREIAGHTLTLLKDSDLSGKLARNGRKLVEKCYSWQKISKNLDRIYKEAVKNVRN